MPNFRQRLKLRPVGAFSCQNELIREGAKVFTKSIFKVIIPAAIGITILLSLFVETFGGLAFLTGLICTSISVIVGMGVGTLGIMLAPIFAQYNLFQFLGIL